MKEKKDRNGGAEGHTRIITLDYLFHEGLPQASCLLDGLLLGKGYKQEGGLNRCSILKRNDN